MNTTERVDRASFMECVNEAKINCRVLFGMDVLSLHKYLFQFLSWFGSNFLPFRIVALIKSVLFKIRAKCVN